jgi:hypothetical protein
MSVQDPSCDTTFKFLLLFGSKNVKAMQDLNARERSPGTTHRSRKIKLFEPKSCIIVWWDAVKGVVVVVVMMDVVMRLAMGRQVVAAQLLVPLLCSECRRCMLYIYMP